MRVYFLAIEADQYLINDNAANALNYNSILISHLIYIHIAKLI